MGLIKPNNYDQDELKFSRIANALSHPARNRILELARTEPLLRNNALPEILNLNQQSVTRHLQCLKQARLIDCRYHVHFDEINVVEETLNYFNEYLTKLYNP